MTEALTPLELSLLDEEKALAELEGKEPEAGDAAEEAVKEAAETAEEGGEDEASAESAESAEGDDPLDDPKTNSDHAKRRIRIRDLEKQATAERERAKYLEGQLAAMQAAKPADPVVAKAEEKKYDPELEFEDYTKQQLKTVEEKLEETRRIQQEIRIQAEGNMLLSQLERSEQLARQKDPEYDAKAELLVEKEYQKLKMLHEGQLRQQYPGAPQEKLDEFMRGYAKQQVATITLQRMREGKDLADEVNAMATQLYGYQPKAQQAAGDKPKGPPKPNLEKIKQNIRKSASLSGGSSRGKAGKATAEEILGATVASLIDMPDHEWDEVG